MESFSTLVQLLNKINQTRQANESVTTKVNKVHLRIADREEQKELFSLKSAVKLEQIYKEAIGKATAEVESIQEALAALEQLQHSLLHQNKKRKSVNGQQQPLASTKESGSLSSQITLPIHALEDSVGQESHSKLFKAGENVAVKLPTNSFWITAHIIRWVSEKLKFEVMDAEEDEEVPGSRKRYLSSAKMIIPIPTAVSDEAYEIGSIVLALFPGSSCFYKALVIKSPIGGNANECYTVRFEDDGSFERQVAAIHVLKYPKIQ